MISDGEFDIKGIEAGIVRTALALIVNFDLEMSVEISNADINRSISVAH